MQSSSESLVGKAAIRNDQLAKTIHTIHYETLTQLAAQFPEPNLHLVSTHANLVLLEPRVEESPIAATANLARRA